MCTELKHYAFSNNEDANQIGSWYSGRLLATFPLQYLHLEPATPHVVARHEMSLTLRLRTYETCSREQVPADPICDEEGKSAITLHDSLLYNNLSPPSCRPYALIFPGSWRPRISSHLHQLQTCALLWQGPTSSRSLEVGHIADSGNVTTGTSGCGGRMSVKHDFALLGFNPPAFYPEWLEMT